MQKVLLVDDDLLIVGIYRNWLTKNGYEVEVAHDGLEAMKVLNSFRPDLVVLDVMMPKFNGLEVLAYIRSRPELAHTRVIVLSNYYAGQQERNEAATQADLHFTKSTCTPVKLLLAAHDLISRSPTAPPPEGAASPAPVATAEPPPAADATATARATADSPNDPKLQKQFLDNAPMILDTLQQLNAAFVQDQSLSARDLHLLNFYRKVHYVTALAGMAGYADIALLCSALEALLLDLHERPKHFNHSTIQTVADSLDFLRDLFAHAEHASTVANLPGKALVVDDDPISARAIAIALDRAGLRVTSFQNPLAALQAATTEAFDLLVLDLVMPGMDGLQFCARIRALPRYKWTPIIFVTGAPDYAARLQASPHRGNDLIAKPVVPLEVALKAVTHLLRVRSSGSEAPA